MLSCVNSAESTAIITLDTKTGIAHTEAIGHYIKQSDPHGNTTNEKQSQWDSQMEEQCYQLNNVN